MVSNPKKIHIATSAYLARFAHNERLMAHRVKIGTSAPCSPWSVGYRKNFWGADAAVASAAESALSRYETPAGRLLSAAARGAVLEGEDRALLASFVAIHSIRTPAFRSFASALTEETIQKRRQGWRHAPDSFERAAQRWRDDPFQWPDTVRRQISRVASALACMHWAIVWFDGPLLITSDQPVVAVPILDPHDRRGASVLPRAGFLNTIEVRFPLDPYHALLASWVDERERVAVKGSLDIACDFNRSLRGQADAEWFYSPECSPAFLRPPLYDPTCSAVAPELFPGYGSATAVASERRKAADRIQQELMNGKASPDTVRWVYAA